MYSYRLTVFPAILKIGVANFCKIKNGLAQASAFRISVYTLISPVSSDKILLIEYHSSRHKRQRFCQSLISYNTDKQRQWVEYKLHEVSNCDYFLPTYSSQSLLRLFRYYEN